MKSKLLVCPHCGKTIIMRFTVRKPNKYESSRYVVKPSVDGSVKIIKEEKQ